MRDLNYLNGEENSEIVRLVLDGDKSDDDDEYVSEEEEEEEEEVQYDEAYLNTLSSYDKKTSPSSSNVQNNDNEEEESDSDSDSDEEEEEEDHEKREDSNEDTDRWFSHPMFSSFNSESDISSDLLKIEKEGKRENKDEDQVEEEDKDEVMEVEKLLPKTDKVWFFQIFSHLYLSHI